MPSASLWAWLALGSSILLGVFGQVFLKLAVDQISSSGLGFYTQILRQAWLYVGFASYGLSFATWLAALRDFDVSFARPLTGTGYILTYAVAVLALGEELSVRRVLGVAVITAGVLVMR